MGQARQRGTFEQRQLEGIEKRKQQEAAHLRRQEKLKQSVEEEWKKLTPKQKQARVTLASMFSFLSNSLNNNNTLDELF